MERELINWLASEFGSTQFATLGIGDDCAVFPASSSELVVTCDVICDGVHFESARHTPEQIGYKALAVNLSDLASMGATPRAATVSLILPSVSNLQYVKRLYGGMRELSARLNVDICGGDTTVWSANLVVAVSAYGQAPEAGCWKISGASPGDRILVTGQLGGSIAGRHMSFEPRCQIADIWRVEDRIRACTDISDSLGLDLAKIARASNVGFEINAGSIPVSAAASELADGIQAQALQRALCDGEDFELIVIANPEDARQLIRQTPADPGLTDIGQITENKRCFLLENGQRHPFEPSGFEHSFFSAESSPGMPADE